MITLKTPAKVNIGLWVENRRKDAYHDIRSLFFPIAIFDTLTFFPITHGVELSCNLPYIPVGSANLVVKAAELFFTYTGVRSGVSIELKKDIPVGHGLGGGSSDASAALLGLNKLFETNLSYDELRALALEIGMDCPFFLRPRPYLVTGRGEDFEKVDIPPFELYIYSPGFGVSTVWAYKHLKRLTKGVNSCRLLLDALVKRDYEEAGKWLYNSFEDVVYGRYPDLGLMVEWFRNKGAWFAGMSGSGSSLFAAFPVGFEVKLPLEQKGKLFRTTTLEKWGVV